jgi:hypothetical protein
MLKHHWTVIVKKSHIDKDSNAMILGEVIEQVTCALPAEAKEKFDAELKKNGHVMLPFEFDVVSYVQGSHFGDEATILLEMELPDGKKLQMNEARIKFGNNTRARNILKSSALPVSQEGANIVRVFLLSGREKTVLTEVPIFIEIKFK